MNYGMSSGALQRMYVDGSLKNEDNGFVFEIKNQVDSGSISGISKLAIDDIEKSLDGITLDLKGKVREATSLSWSASLYVSYGATVKIYVPEALAAGEHTIKMTLKVPELGQITIPITDTIS